MPFCPLPLPFIFYFLHVLNTLPPCCDKTVHELLHAVLSWLHLRHQQPPYGPLFLSFFIYFFFWFLVEAELQTQPQQRCLHYYPRCRDMAERSACKPAPGPRQRMLQQTRTSCSPPQHDKAAGWSWSDTAAWLLMVCFCSHDSPVSQCCDRKIARAMWEH